MMLRIPKFGKRVIPKGPRENEAQFFHTIFYGYSPGSLDLWVIRPATSFLDQDPTCNFPWVVIISPLYCEARSLYHGRNGSSNLPRISLTLR